MIFFKNKPQKKESLELLIKRYKKKYRNNTLLLKISESLQICTSLLVGYGSKVYYDTLLNITSSDENTYPFALTVSLMTYLCTIPVKNQIPNLLSRKFNFKKTLPQDKFLESNKSIDKVCNWVYNHPKTIGTGVFLTFTKDLIPLILYQNALNAYRSPPPENLSLLNYGLLGIYGFTLFGVNHVIKTFKLVHKLKRKGVLKEFIKVGAYRLTNNNQGIIKELNKWCKKSNSYNVQLTIANELIKLGKLEESLNHISAIPRLIKEKQFISTHNEGYMFNLKGNLTHNIRKSEKKTIKKFDDFYNHIEIALHNLILNDYQTVQDCVTLACNVDPEHRTEANVLGSLIYEHVPIDGLAEEQWEKTIDLVLEDEKLKYSIITESNSDVYRLDPKNHKFLSNFFVFKANKDIKVLEDEAAKTKELEELVKDAEEFGTAKSFHLSENIDGRYFYVTRYSDGKTLSESDDIEDYKKAAKYLGLIHKEMRSDNGQVTTRNDFTKRIEESFSESEKERIITNIDVVYDSINGDLVFNKDSHGDNWIITGEEKVIAIDIEDKGYVNQFTDLIKISEYTNLYGKDYDKRKQIWDSYFEGYGKKQLSQKEIELSCLNATILKAFTFYSYAKDKESETQHPFRKDAQRNIVDNAISSIERIKEKYSTDYSKSDWKKYRILQETLSSLKIHT